MYNFGKLLGLTLLSLVAASIISSHHKVFAADCDMIVPTSAGSVAANCLNYVDQANTSGVSSGAGLVSALQADEGSGVPADVTSAQWIVSRLAPNGDMASLQQALSQPDVTVSVVPLSSISGNCNDTGYNYTTNSVEQFTQCDSGGDSVLLIQQGGRQIFALRRVCGNAIGSVLRLTLDTPPSGSFSVTCNTIGTATLRISISDPQGAPTATAKIGGWTQSGLRNGNSVTVPYNYVENAGTASLTINNVGPLGSQLNRTITTGFPACNKAPAGNIGTAQCNSNNNTYTISVTFSDGNGATQARLIGKDGKQYATANSPGASWTLQTANTPRTAFPMSFQVADVDGGTTLSWVTRGTLTLSGAMNCPPRDDITAVSCHAVSIKLWDPNAPTNSIQFRVGLNGGSSEGGGTFNGGQNGSRLTYDLAGLGDFDPWIHDKVVLYGLDADTGNNAVQIGSVTLPGNVCDSLSCATSSLPGTGLVAKEPTSFYVTEKIIAPNDAPNLGNIGPKNAHFTVQIGPGLILNDTRNYTTPVSATTLQSTPVDVFTPPDSGNFNLSWQLVGAEAPSGPSCGKAVQAGYEPFFTVEGGDIAAGPGFGAGCTEQSTPASITAYNLDNPAFGAYSYFGSGSQLGAFANGDVTHFVTDSTNVQANNKSVSTNGSTTAPYTSPTGLSFSNSSAAATTYGGGFNRSSGWCVPDYEGQATATAAGAPDYSTTGTRTYTLPANSTIGNITVQPGARVTLVVTGNVYINGNITYNESYTVGAGDITPVPQFTLLIKGGNLYISNTVTTLNGFYDVQPSSNNGGTLYTCASGLGADYGQNYNACNHPLTFYGAVSAAKLKLERTYGSLITAGTAPNTPSERFVYTPELWLGNLVGPSCKDDPNSLGCLYQAYTALPPVL